MRISYWELFEIALNIEKVDPSPNSVTGKAIQYR